MPRNAALSDSTPIILPEPVKALRRAHRAMCRHFEISRLTFTLDGKLVGDIAEVLVSEAYALTPCEGRISGVDAKTSTGKTVQIKATQKPKTGPAFTHGKGKADFLIFIRIDFDAGTAHVLYNGPEAPVRSFLPAEWKGTKRVRLRKIEEIDQRVRPQQRLPRVS